MSKIKKLKEYLKKQTIEIREAKVNVSCFINDSHKLSILKRMSKNYRVHHIAYCLLRGKTYEQIEKKCRENNKPNMLLIQEIKNVYTQDVCISS